MVAAPIRVAETRRPSQATDGVGRIPAVFAGVTGFFRAFVQDVLGPTGQLADTGAASKRTDGGRRVATVFAEEFGHKGDS